VLPWAGMTLASVRQCLGQADHTCRELKAAFLRVVRGWHAPMPLYGNEPSAIEQAYAIFANVLEVDDNGKVLNAIHAQKRATDYIRAYCDPSFRVEPPYAHWETELLLPASRTLC
jgi:hypothetical protein